MNEKTGDGPAALGRKMRSAGGVYGLLVLASVVYGAGLFTGLGQWGRGDWDQFTFRYETPRVAMLRDRQLPLWNPYVNGGNVLLAHPHCPALSPWYLPALVLGAPLGLRFQVVLFMAVGATGMAALLRGWGVSHAGCLLGGVLLMMSTHFALHVTEGHLEWCLLGLISWVMLCLVQAACDWRLVVLGGLLLASAVLHGSIYIVAMFAPLMAVWAVLESLRTRSGRTAIRCAAMLVLAFLLSAVVLFPRMEFLRAHPRTTGRRERVSPTAFAQMFLSPHQAKLYRATRDVRNPPEGVMARILPSQFASSASLQETLKWHRLDLVLTTTSDWTDVRFTDKDARRIPYILFIGKPKADMTQARLNSLRPSTEWLAIQNLDWVEPEVTKRATLYCRLPEVGNLYFVVTRGNQGETRLTVTRGEDVLLDATHATMVPGDLTNRRRFRVSRSAILGEEASAEATAAGQWYRIEAALTTSADWCDVQVVNAPYLFRIRQAPTQQQAGVQPSMSSLVTGSPAPGKAETSIRAALYFQCPAKSDLRVATIQGRIGTSTLKLETPEGKPLEAVCNEVTEPGGEKTHQYVLANGLIRRQLQPLPPPLRWQLDRRGMVFDWHEYGCYVTWLGLALGACGLVVSFRRQWPLTATGALAALVALGAALPLDLWALWKLLPMYGSLQVSARLLVAVVFVMAVAGGYGMDRLGRGVERLGGPRLRRLAEGGVVLAVYVELAVMGWNLFSDVFVCPPGDVPAHTRFAQRYAGDHVRRAAMYSAHYPYLLANSGVIKDYENIAVKRAKVRITTDPDYRGETYLEGSHGTARIVDWSMSRVKVALEVDAPDWLVLNQNYFLGWKAARRGPDGRIDKRPAEPSPDGLVSIEVGPRDREVEFYYRPDSFVAGAAVSGLTLLGCLGLLLGGSRGSWKSWKTAPFAAAMVRGWSSLLRSRAFGYAVSALVLNGPFLICHPAWTLVDAPPVRSLAINMVLFLAPGLPLVGVMIGRGWRLRLGLLWAMALSFVVFAAWLVATHLAGRAVNAATLWNGTWMVTNLGLLLNALVGGPPAWGIGLQDRRWWLAVGLFAAAYGAFFLGATRVVPAMQDHDLDIQSPGYALLSRLEPQVVNDRKILYYFAHPLLLNCYEAASFVYFNQFDYLARFDEATRRTLAVESGAQSDRVDTEFCRLPDKRLVHDRDEFQEEVSRHRIVGVEAGDYLVAPPLPDRGERIPVRELEVELLYDDYHHDPRRLETRTPNVFLAALTVALLGWWIMRWTDHWWMGLLVPCTYATSPEVFVRSSYGGYFAISALAAVLILLAVEQRTSDGGRAAWMSGFLAGGFAALANNKLLLLPAALVVWEFLRWKRTAVRQRLARAILHPVVLGFALGTAAFWAYGLAISPEAFWADYLRIHLVNRVIHHNPFGYQGYPTAGGLWREFWQHTGYVLLPLGIVALALLCGTDGADNGAGPTDRATRRWRGMPGLWAFWAVLTALAFSLIDWRQTKHLMPLLLPLHLAPARWAAMGNVPLAVAGVLLAGLFVWNVDALRLLATDFHAFPITPAW